MQQNCGRQWNFGGGYSEKGTTGKKSQKMVENFVEVLVVYYIHMAQQLFTTLCQGIAILFTAERMEFTRAMLHLQITTWQASVGL